MPDACLPLRVETVNPDGSHDLTLTYDCGRLPPSALGPPASRRGSSALGIGIAVLVMLIVVVLAILGIGGRPPPDPIPPPERGGIHVEDAGPPTS